MNKNMPGFFVSNVNTNQTTPENYDNSRCYQGSIASGEWAIQWNVLDKFQDDKCFFETEKYIVVLDGVILNKKELLEKHNESNWQNLLVKLIEGNESFFELFRGAFAGAYYDKVQNRWVAYTDQIGNHLLLYYFDGKIFALASQLNYLTDWMKGNQIQRCISQKWINDMLSFGYVLDTHSIIDSCTRIFPGSYIVYDASSRQLEEKSYYRIKKTMTTLSEEEIIEQLDFLFKNAVKRFLAKCDEYGYRAITDISGGLDSRMIAAIVHDLGLEYKTIGINYAQVGSNDQKIALKVSQASNIEMLTFPMDKGNCLKDIDSLIFMNQGMNFYAGITGGKFVLENLDRATYGMELWGILGDVYDGAMVVDKSIDDLQWDYPRYRTSRFFPVFNQDGYSRVYTDNELMWFYIRGMIGGQNTALIRQNFVEAPALFGDVEFMEFIFSIPYDTRVFGHIYRKWMKKKYPSFSDIVYSGTETKVCVSDKEEWFRKLPMRLKYKIAPKVCKKLFDKHSSMNPVDYWLKNNSSISTYYNEYYLQNIDVLNCNSDLKEKTSSLYLSDSAMDKILALSIIAAVKMFIA